MIIPRLLRPRRRRLLLLCLGALTLAASAATITTARATSNYEYGPDEYVTVARGLSPDGKYAVTAHGAGDLGTDRFHLYLTDAATGKKIGPLEEIKDALDTGADAFCARWSPDSQEVLIVYRVDRHAPLKAVSYHIGARRARRLKGPYDVAAPDLIAYWGEQCSAGKPSEKTFGTPLAR